MYQGIYNIYIIPPLSVSFRDIGEKLLLLVH